MREKSISCHFHLIGAIIPQENVWFIVMSGVVKASVSAVEWPERAGICSARGRLVAKPKTRSRSARTIWLVASKEYLKAPSSAFLYAAIN